MSLSTVLDEKVKTSPCSPWPMMGGTPGCRLMTEEHDGSFTHTSMFLCHSRLWSGHCPSVSRVCVLHMPLVWPHLQHPSVRNLHAPFKWTIFYTASLEAGTFPLNCNLFVKAHMWRLVYVCVFLFYLKCLKSLSCWKMKPLLIRCFSDGNACWSKIWQHFSLLIVYV